MKKLTFVFTLIFACFLNHAMAYTNQNERTAAQKNNRITIYSIYELNQNIGYTIDAINNHKMTKLTSCTYTAEVTVQKGGQSMVLELSNTAETCEEAYNEIVATMKQIWEDTGMI